MKRLQKLTLILILGLSSCVACSIKTGAVSPISGDMASTDEDINTNVQVRIAADYGLHYQNIHVSTYERVVKLTGSVDNPTQAQVATVLARSVPGVKSVVTDIVVKGRQ